MKLKKFISVVVIVTMLFSVFFIEASAQEDFSFDVSVTPEVIKVGDTITMKISLNGYTSETIGIRGLQIDINNVDTNVLKVIEYKSLVGEEGVASNTGSYSKPDNRVRYLYANLSGGAMETRWKDIFEVTFQVNPELEKDGEITLPIIMKIQTMKSGPEGRITLTSEYNISYSVNAEPVYNVDITWGALSYTYSDGTWNAQTHMYEGEGWTDNETGFVKVKNNGETETSVKFVYSTERTDIKLHFEDDRGNTVNNVVIASTEEKKVYGVLDGKPTETLENTAIGRITVIIGGE